MSDNEWDVPPPPPPIMDQIAELEGLVQNLKTKALAADNDMHASSIICSEQKDISNYLDTMEYSARCRGNKVVDDLISALSDENAPINSEFWIDFNDKLKLFETSDENYRKCLHKGWWTNDNVDYEEDPYDCTLMHLVCKNNPPVEVVKTLIDLIPTKMGAFSIYRVQYNHLACDACGRYPLHMIAQYGGSLDVVRLLVDADDEKKTIKPTEPYNYESNGSVYHMLIDNRNVHEPEAFSNILRYLCCMSVASNLKGQELEFETYGRNHGYDEDFSLLYSRKNDFKRPIELLFEGLDSDDLKAEEVLGHIGFIFLLKATCYSYFQLEAKVNELHLIEYDDISREIEKKISLSHAFVVCSFTPVFQSKDFLNVSLDYLLSTDSQFLMEKDADGQYPIHIMIMNRTYFLQMPQLLNRISRKLEWSDGDGAEVFITFIFKAIMRNVPQCAQQLNDEGLLPLHLASDPNRINLHDSHRVDLVRAIWEAYPEASEVVDESTGLPPFALAARRMHKTWPKKHPSEDDDSEFSSDISISFFLLRENPEILSKYIGSSQQFDPILDILEAKLYEKKCEAAQQAKRHKSSGGTCNWRFRKPWELS